MTLWFFYQAHPNSIRLLSYGFLCHAPIVLCPQNKDHHTLTYSWHPSLNHFCCCPQGKEHKTCWLPEHQFIDPALFCEAWTDSVKQKIKCPQNVYDIYFPAELVDHVGLNIAKWKECYTSVLKPQDFKINRKFCYAKTIGAKTHETYAYLSDRKIGTSFTSLSSNSFCVTEPSLNLEFPWFRNWCITLFLLGIVYTHWIY